MIVQRKKYFHKPPVSRVKRVIREMNKALVALDYLKASPLIGNDDRCYVAKVTREQETLSESIKRNLIDRYA